MVTRVKICGITRPADGDKALELGADALGFVMEPTSPRYVGANIEIMDYIRSLGPYVTTFAVYGHVAEPFPAVSLVQHVEGVCNHPHVLALRMRAGEVLTYEAADFCRALLLDAFDPHVYGGTGNTVDWLAARAFVQSSPLPVILAGGLNPDNVGSAIRAVRPYGVDVSSGVEASPGIKDPSKMHDFIVAAKS